MFQTFTTRTRPEDGPPRLARLRAEMDAEGLDAWIVPRADAHQGETVAPRDERLAWLTGFTGSAGFAAVTAGEAAVFVDGRYRVQVRAQTDGAAFTPVDWPETPLADWLKEHLPEGARIGLDPWLHTRTGVRRLEGAGLAVHPSQNLVDRIWEDQPEPPSGAAEAWPDELAGETSAARRARIAKALVAEGQSAAVLTLPDSIAWLLNIRGSDVARMPVVLAFAILHSDARMEIFTDPSKFADLTLDAGVTVKPVTRFAAALARLEGTVRADPGTAPFEVFRLLEEAGVTVAEGDDPAILPKSRKSAAEIAATREAHLRDAAAMVEFLAWLDAEADTLSADPDHRLTEIDVVTRLEAFRRATNALRDIAFETICGAGPDGAIVHYRVTEDTNRAVQPGELLLVDSGGQYLDGTTDVTRTIAIGPPGPEEKAAFTRVLRGMIEISRARWPAGLAGRDLDPLARIHLWRAGQDFDHGTGHGVGVYLGVHEGPQRLSKRSDVALEEGMILSNEPGYYREGAFGIRIENLVVVIPAPELDGGDPGRRQLAFETLTYVPIDTRLIDDTLPAEDRDWLNAYHAEVADRIGPRVSEAARGWLTRATAKI